MRPGVTPEHAEARAPQWLVAAALAGVWLALAASPALAQPSLRLRMLEAEDARASSPDGLAPLLEGLASSDGSIRRIAVRALGRMERPPLVATIRPLLADTDPDVRIEAANALAQSVKAGGAADVAALDAALAPERVSGPRYGPKLMAHVDR